MAKICSCVACRLREFGTYVVIMLTPKCPFVRTMLPTKFQVKWLLGLGEEAKKRFSRSGSHLGFPISMILATFDLQVTLIGVNRPFGSGEEEKNRFSRW